MEYSLYLQKNAGIVGVHEQQPGAFKPAWRHCVDIHSVSKICIWTVGFEVLTAGRSKILLFTLASRPALGPNQPPFQCVSDAVSSGVKRQGREADHSLPSSAGVKSGQVIPSLLRTFIHSFIHVLYFP
jgi:hypothetical protein